MYLLHVRNARCNLNSKRYFSIDFKELFRQKAQLALSRDPQIPATAVAILNVRI